MNSACLTEHMESLSVTVALLYVHSQENGSIFAALELKGGEDILLYRSKLYHFDLRHI